MQCAKQARVQDCGTAKWALNRPGHHSSRKPATDFTFAPCALVSAVNASTAAWQKVFWHPAKAGTVHVSPHVFVNGAPSSSATHAGRPAACFSQRQSCASQCMLRGALKRCSLARSSADSASAKARHTSSLNIQEYSRRPQLHACARQHARPQALHRIS